MVPTQGKAPNSREVQELIANDITTSNSLLSLLKIEHQALKDRDQKTIHEALEVKQELMKTLEANAGTRQQWLVTEYPQLATDETLDKSAYWDEFLTRLGGPTLFEKWLILKDQINCCKVSNETNGKIISRSQQTIKQLLSIIRGQSADAPKLYTARGQTKVQQYSQSVTKA